MYSHHSGDAQYVAKKACMLAILIFFLIVILQWGYKGGEGAEELVYTRVTTCLNENKKGGETSKSKILLIYKGRI